MHAISARSQHRYLSQLGPTCDHSECQHSYRYGSRDGSPIAFNYGNSAIAMAGELELMFTNTEVQKIRWYLESRTG